MNQEVLFVNVRLEEAKKDFLIAPPDKWDLTRLRLGRDAWILQTVARLKEFGYEFPLTDQFENGKVCIAHWDDLEHISNRNMTYNAVARADRPHCIFADYEIVLNKALIERKNQVYIPHWMQPGLIPRSPERGVKIENVAFIGTHQELHPELWSESFRQELRKRGLNLLTPDNWTDFSELDVILAIRSGDPSYYKIKPASKLVNAWAAGIPAILGPEPAFQELRRSELDYFEARTARDALAALDQLLASPELYTKMVQNGEMRAKDFTHEQVAKAWMEALEGKILPHFRTWQGRMNPMRKFYRRALNHMRKRRFHQDRIDYDKWHRANIQSKFNALQASKGVPPPA